MLQSNRKGDDGKYYLTPSSYGTYKVSYKSTYLENYVEIVVTNSYNSATKRRLPKGVTQALSRLESTKKKEPPQRFFFYKHTKADKDAFYFLPM